MSAWVEDAQTLSAARELSRAQSSVLLRTSDVDDFLTKSNLHSGALVAPKGFGKTFILKLKRVALQSSDYKCLPNGLIVDRPKGRPPILPNEIIDVLESSGHWETLWQVAIVIALLKGWRDDSDAKLHLDAILEECGEYPAIKNLVKNPYIDSVFEVFHSLLSSSRSELFAIFNHSAIFTSAFGRFNKQTAIFIDNIDEYLEEYINFAHLKRSDLNKRYLRLWHNGQVGAWLAVRRLNGINAHVKIFVSIRKEAFHFASKNEQSYANLRSFFHELKYSRQDIKQIIVNNIQAESKSNLVEKDAVDPIISFVGTRSEFISNSGTGKQEEILDYWLRHCTLRPRDAVMIGREISKLKPNERTKVTIRSAINSAAADLVQSLFNEISPFCEGLVPEIFPQVVETNVLSRDVVVRLSKKYQDVAKEKYHFEIDREIHPFCMLYSSGLFGIVQDNRDKEGHLIQKFSPIGVIPFGDIEVLPRADTYLVHPALSDYISMKNVSYLKSLNRHNVVGGGLEWRAEEELRFVAIGDMRGYRSKVMTVPGPSQTFGRFWQSVFAQHTNDLDLAKISSGDAVLLADRSPIRLLKAIRGISTALSNSGYNMAMRFGAHCGHWTLEYDDDGVAQPSIGEIIGIAARIEPIGQPGMLLMSSSFYERARAMGPNSNFEEAKIVSAEDIASADLWSDNGVLISKSGKEVDERVVLYAISATAA